VPRISLRTLIPLTRHLNASLALLAEEVIRRWPYTPFQNSLRLRHSRARHAAPPVGKKSSAPMVEVAGRDAKQVAGQLPG